MIIKRYIVDNMNEAMTKIRYELGNDAVIVSQRKIKQNGILGFLKPKKIEVTAAADDKTKKAKEVKKESTVSTESNASVQKELSELKTLIQDLVAQKEAAVTVTTTAAPSTKKESKSKAKQRLLDNDVPDEIIEQLYEIIKSKNEGKKLTAKLYETELKASVEEMIKIDKNLNDKIHVLVGPTGVGKTTTIAKLASHFTLYKGKKVGLITIDTYRIGAVEQLKTYAEILGVPFEVVLSTNDLKNAVKKMEDCEIIFVDTTGRNSKNIMQVSETRKYVDELGADKIHLVLSMTTKQKDIKKIIENYRMVNYNSLILTKIDETDTWGSVLGAIHYGDVPVSYICAGQNVPDDIEEARKDRLTKLIMGAE
jgi:flagellar biosynthesis protein FlhF